jgi:protein subunit release factor A
MSKQKVFTIDKKQLDLNWFSQGKGGQYQNKHPANLKLTHKPTGVMVTATAHRERRRNLKDALNTLSKDRRVLAWVNGQINGIEEKVEHEMKNNIKIEHFKDGEWVEE